MPLHLRLGEIFGDVLEEVGPDIARAGLRRIGVLPQPATTRSQPPIVFEGMGFAGAGAGGGTQMAGLFPDFTPMLPEFLGGDPSPVRQPRRGGIAMGGVAPGFFHATPSGRVMPNSLTLAQDPLGNLAFFVHAGKPTHFSKIGKYPRARHHHGHPRHHRPR